MKSVQRLFLAVALLVAPAAPLLAADAFVFGFSPRTGDAFLDAELGDINVLVRGGIDGFVDDVVVRFGAPRTVVRTYVVERRWAPADVYYACAIAAQLHRPCVEVIRVYERDHRLGWGVIARRLGIAPGSPAFHALKARVGPGHSKYRADHERREHRGRGERSGRGHDGHHPAGHGNHGNRGNHGGNEGHPERGRGH